MAVQFLCPQGHVLEGEPSQAGQPCRCPYCGSEFVIPNLLPVGGEALPPQRIGEVRLPDFQPPPGIAHPATPRYGEPAMPVFQPPPGSHPLAPAPMMPAAPMMAPVQPIAPLAPLAPLAPVWPQAPAGYGMPPLAAAPAMPGVPLPARAPFELPPAAMPPPMAPAGRTSAFDLPAAQPMPNLAMPPPAAAAPPADVVPAMQPGGIALPFDPRAKAELPFELPDDTHAPLTFDLPAAAPMPLDFSRPAPPPLVAPQIEPALPPLPGAQPAPADDQPADDLLEAEAAPLDVVEVQAEVPLHIPCPSGHTLEVTRDVLGKEVMCPFCRKRFLPVWERSLEYLRQRAQIRVREENQLGRIWLSGAIVAAIVVLAALIALINFIAAQH